MALYISLWGSGAKLSRPNRAGQMHSPMVKGHRINNYVDAATLNITNNHETSAAVCLHNVQNVCKILYSMSETCQNEDVADFVLCKWRQ